ncbi:NADPH:quinone reductase [Orbus sturtevantii]|uniref:NADPH:quinone reductase n=1 Tax=Orbus sturtevantii TaxID=3074109 RepID=UPI00370DA410
MPKRIAFSRYGDSDVLEYLDFDVDEPKSDEVVVENKAIGINYIDTYIRSGLYPVKTLPSGLGSEAAGIVTHIGDNVTDFKVGDRVAYAQASLGAYSQYHLVNENILVKLPDEVTFEQAAASMLKGLTVYYLLTQTYPLKQNEIFLFHAAAGGVGSIACQWSKIIGAKMIATAGSDEKISIAKKNGAWQGINYNVENVVERVLALTKQQKVNVVYDSIGKNMWIKSLDCLKRRGLMVSFGNSSGPVTDVNLAILNQKGSLYVTRPSLASYITNKTELNIAANEFFSYVAKGAIDITIREQQKFALKDAATAHKIIQSRKTIGPSLLIP